MPLFTVITIVYNSGKFLRDTIESVLSQQYKDFEYIISDDCSQDDSWNIIESFTDPRIRKIRNEKNIGEYANRANALKYATGKYVIYIDGDDIIYEHALQVFADYIYWFPECAMIFSRDWDFRILYPYKVEPLEIYRFEYLDGGIIGGNFTKVLFKTEVLKAYPIPNDIRSGDTYIQLKISQKYNAIVVPEGLTWWRRRSGNATEKLFENERHLAESVNYRIDLLGDGCPLPEAEKEWAKTNIYGLYLRQLIRMLLRFKWPTAFYLFTRIHVPLKYFKSVLIPARANYYKNITGDNPLHTQTASAQRFT